MLLVNMLADILQICSLHLNCVRIYPGMLKIWEGKNRNGWLFISKQHLQNGRVKKWNFKCFTKGKALGKHYLLQTWDMFRKTTVPELLIIDIRFGIYSL